MTRGTSAVLVSLSLLVTSCAARERLRPGLANGPRLGSDPPPFSHDASHDAVANADDSCPSAAAPQGARDPLPQRVFTCPATQERAPNVVLLSATVQGPPPKAVPLRFHLEGLPPCDDPSTPWISSDSRPLCAR